MSQPEVRFTFEIQDSHTKESEAQADSPQFDVVEFTLEEGLNQNFRLEVELNSFDANANFNQLLDQGACLSIYNGNALVRRVQGLISHFTQGKTGFKRTRYTAVVESMLFRTEFYSDWRIFQQKSVPEILAHVFKDDGLDNISINTHKEHLQREYCVQADETDFAFIKRLMAEEGLVYRFEHQNTHHQLLATDTAQALGAMKINFDGSSVTTDDKGNPVVEPVFYQPNPAGEKAQPSLNSFIYKEQVRTAKQTQRDYTFKNPKYAQEHTSSGKGQSNQSQAYEEYTYPGRYKADAAGKPFTQTKIESLRRDANIAIAVGDDARIEPGLAFELVGHPRKEHNKFWRAVHITHQGTQHSAAEEEAAQATQSTSYSQTAELVPAATEWKAPIPAKPRILGPQIAHVTGPEGEEIYTDEYGRVKVLFPWDRQNAQDEHSSCWIRVSQGWAGAAWGQMEIPRIGQEVIISFLDADPDQPIISGRAHDAIHPTPYKLPGLKTLSTLKSKEHKGDGYNELLIDDTTGELKTQLHSTHAATQLTLGYLTHPRSTDGSGEHRGDGFELRSDDWGSIRAGKGLYVSTDKRESAQGKQLDLQEAINQLKGALDIAQQLSQASQTAGALPVDAQSQQNQLSQTYEELKRAGILVSSPAGIALTTPKSTQISAGENIQLTAAQSIDASSAKDYRVAAGDGVSLFAIEKEMRLIANKGKVQLQAQHNELEVTAQDDLTISSTKGKTTIAGKEELFFTCGGAYIKIKEGQVEIGGEQVLNVKMAGVNMLGPNTMDFDYASFTATHFGLNDEMFVLKGQDGNPIPEFKYKILRDDGQTFFGMTNNEGETMRVSTGSDQLGLTIQEDDRE